MLISTSLGVLHVLQYLNLDDNKLSSLRETVFKEYLLKSRRCKCTLHIMGNEFKCDCGMLWVRAMYLNISMATRNRPRDLYSSEHVLCSANMSTNVSVRCFIRGKPFEKCGQVNVERCIKGKLFNYIYIYFKFNIYI